MDKGQPVIHYNAVHKIFRRTSRIKGKKVWREQKAVIMAVFNFPHKMHHIFIDKDCLSRLYPNGMIECTYFNDSVQYIDKLQVLMPVHDLKSRIPRVGILAYYVKDKVRKIRVDIQIDRVDIIFLFQIHLPFSFGNITIIFGDFAIVQHAVL